MGEDKAEKCASIWKNWIEFKSTRKYLDPMNKG